MFRKLFSNRAQTTLEYAILIGIVVGGLIAMQIYVKRGLQGKLKENADSMGAQFSPGYTTSSYTTSNTADSSETLAGEVTTTTISGQTTDRTGAENVDVLANEYWWE